MASLTEKYRAGKQESESLGRELAAKRQNIDEYKRATGTPAMAPPKIATESKKMYPIDRVNKGASTKYGSRPGEKRIDVSKMVRPLGSFRKGGKVKRTGTYRLHKGERVLNRKQNLKLGRLASRKIHAPVKSGRKGRKGGRRKRSVKRG